MTCPLCAQPYDSGVQVLNRIPKLLICGHLCCLECIQFVAGANGAGFTCPQTVSQGNDEGRGHQWRLDRICGQTTVRPDGGFESLMTGLQNQIPSVMPPPGPDRDTFGAHTGTIGACQVTRMAIRVTSGMDLPVGHTVGELDAQFHRLPHALPWSGNVNIQFDHHAYHYPHTNESDSDSLPSLVSSNHDDASDTEPATQ
jgi:hypothetical protein